MCSAHIKKHIEDRIETILGSGGGGGGGGRDEYAVSLLKTGAESGSHVLKTTVFLTSLREQITYSMICNSFHIFHDEIIRE